MDASDLEVHRLDAARRGDFFGMHCDAKGTGWCYCVAWHVPTWDGWPERSDAENRALRAELFERGVHDGYLLYRAGQPIGWCQAAPRDGFPKLVRQLDLAPDPEAWALTCFAVQPGHRRQGLARALLDRVLDDLARRGVRRVEAFPKRGADLEEGRLWNGPEAMFLAAGFRVLRDHPERPVLGRELAVDGAR
ncbi:MAG: GNAT family N-acetyltransferase [Planctomycetota bacterium]